MESNKYLTLKGRNKDTWYIQVRVPKHLHKIAKKSFIKQSTKTSDIKLARKQRDEVVGQLKSLEERHAQGEFKLLVDNYLGLDKEKLLEIQEQVTDKLRDEYPWVGHPEQGDLPNPTDEEMIEVDALSYAITGEMPDKYKLTLTQAMAQNWRYSEYSDKTKSSHKKAVQRFNNFLNSKDFHVASIERYHALEFKLHLEKNSQLANGTISRHFTDLGVIWNYARGVERYAYENPFAKHGIKVKASRAKYLPWDIDDLRKVLATMKDDRDKLVVYLGWYTGARLGECLSVRPEDIYKDEKSGVWVVSIKPDRSMEDYLNKTDASMKTENARRIVPIHRELLKPLQQFKIEGKGWKRKLPNSYSNYFSRQKKLIKDTVNKMSKQYCFHSIRHNVATNFENANVKEAISARLVGHSIVGATMTYGYYSEGVKYEEALEAVNKLPVL
jgi:integrase